MRYSCMLNCTGLFSLFNCSDSTIVQRRGRHGEGSRRKHSTSSMDRILERLAEISGEVKTLRAAVGEQGQHERKRSLETVLKEVEKEDTPLKKASNIDQLQFVVAVRKLTQLAKEKVEHGDAEELQDTLEAILAKLDQREKLIRLADRSDLGWAVAKRYQEDPIALDSDDEKRIRRAEKAAEKVKKEAELKRKVTGNKEAPLRAAVVVLPVLSLLLASIRNINLFII